MGSAGNLFNSAQGVCQHLWRTSRARRTPVRSGPEGGEPSALQGLGGLVDTWQFRTTERALPTPSLTSSPQPRELSPLLALLFFFISFKCAASVHPTAWSPHKPGHRPPHPSTPPRTSRAGRQPPPAWLPAASTSSVQTSIQ